MQRATKFRSGPSVLHAAALCCGLMVGNPAAFAEEAVVATSAPEAANPRRPGFLLMNSWLVSLQWSLAILLNSAR